MSGTAAESPPGIGTGQALHFTCLAALLVLAWAAWHLVGEPSPLVFWTSIAVPVVHQVYVWLAWRLELRSSAVSRSIGFRAYLVLFFAFIIGRVIAVLALAWADAGSLGLPAAPRAVFAVLAGLVWMYLGYSITRYFGYVRAAGADHFDPAYRDMPLVKNGIFRFTDNGMYTFGFLVLWIIAVGFDSTAALIAAAFNQTYIWVHFRSVEKPDMAYLYAAECEGGA